jgi:hypothetical protein
VAAVVPGLGFPLSSIASGCDAALARHIAERLVPVRGRDLRVRTTAAFRIAASAFHQTLAGRESSFLPVPNVLVLEGMVVLCEIDLGETEGRPELLGIVRRIQRAGTGGKERYRIGIEFLRDPSWRRYEPPYERLCEYVMAQERAAGRRAKGWGRGERCLNAPDRSPVAAQ